MKILNILHTPKIGGTEVAYLKLCEQISKAPNVVELICLIPEKSEIYQELLALSCNSEQKIKIIKNNKLYKNPRFLDFIFIKQLRNILLDYKINAIIANNGRITLLAKKAAAKICPVISVNHGTNPKKTAKADYAFVVNSFQYEQVKNSGLPKERIFLIPNSLTINKKIIEKDKNEIPVIGAFGRLSKEKGFDCFLNAIAILKNNGTRFDVILGGDGEKMKELVRLAKTLNIENQVQFLGWIEDKESFFKKIDLFCLPSKEEAFGIVLLEAMNYKTPIVATNCYGPIDIIEDGVDGLICQINNPESMAKSLETLINNQKLRHKYSESAFNKLKLNYSDEVVRQKIYRAINLIDLNNN